MRIVVAKCKHLSKVSLLFFSFVTIFAGSVLADGGDNKNDKTKKKEKKQEKLEDFSQNVESPTIKFNSLEEIDKTLVNFEGENAIDDHFVEDLENRYDNEPMAAQLKGKAKSVTDAVEAAGSFINFLDTSVLQSLPVGISKRIGNTKVTLAVSSVKLTPRYAELTIYAKLTAPQGKDLFFGVTGLKLSYNNGIIGDARLVLLGDFTIPFNGGKSSLLLKGGFNMQTGEVGAATYITIDCNGFKELGLSGEVVFPTTMLKPVRRANRTDTTGQVTASFSTVATNWNDILVELRFNCPFQIAGLKGFNFLVEGAVLDFSDLRKSSTVVYPNGYEQRFLANQPVELWRGVYIKQFDIELPEAFKRTGNQPRVTFGATDLLIDNNGVSGLFYGENVINIDNGTASGWRFSLDSIRINLVASRLTRAGFAGNIGLPVASQTTLGYDAVITSSNDYAIRVTNRDTLDFDVWAAKVVLLPNSYINLNVVNNNFKPEAMLNGSLSIGMNRMSATSAPAANEVASFKGIIFRQLLIKTTSPKLSASYFGYNGVMKLSNFPVSIENLSITAPTNSDEVALAFRLNVEFHGGKIGGHADLKIIAQWQQVQQNESLKFRRLEVSEVAINADFGGFAIDGRVAFNENEFRGSIKLKLKDLAEIQSSIVFGAKSYRYWYFDAMASIPNGIGTGIIQINGLGGGAYYHMKRMPNANAMGSTGMDYIPDSTAGLGFKASVLFSAISSKVAQGEASFEMAFNRNGGLRYIGLFGAVKISAGIDYGANMVAYLKNKLKGIEELASSRDAETADRLKMSQPSDAGELFFPRSFSLDGEGVAGTVGIQYDFNNSTFDASFNVHMKLAGGMIRGIGQYNRAGWAKFHVGPDGWYLRVGTPSNRIGLKFDIGIVSAEVKAYLMVGKIDEPFPNPPASVTEIIGAYNSSASHASNNLNKIGAGNGFAFGLQFDFGTRINFAIVFASFNATVGFDLFVQDFSGQTCANTGQEIGFNGWYMRGQAYASIGASVGVEIDLFFGSFTLDLLSLRVAALIRAELPRPTFVTAKLAARVSFIGFSGTVDLSFTFGERCTPNSQAPAALLKRSFIADMRPDSSSRGNSVLMSPTVAFNQPIEKDIYLSENSDRKFRMLVDTLKLEELNNGQKVRTLKAELGNSKQLMALRVVDLENRPTRLKPFTKYKFTTRVSFEEWIDGAWMVVRKNGEKYLETKESIFETREYPDSLTINDVSISWPVIQQSNFYKDEKPTGFIYLKNYVTTQKFNDLFTSFNNYYVQFKDDYGNVYKSPVTKDASQLLIQFPLPDILKGRNYSLQILGRNVGVSYDSFQVDKKFLKRTESGTYQEVTAGSIGVYAVLPAVVIDSAYKSEILLMLKRKEFSNSSITYFFGLDEMRRVLFLKAAGLDPREIYEYVNLRGEVIRKLLAQQGYGTQQIDTYMAELNNIVETSNAVANLVTNDEAQRPILQYNFRASNFGTFGEKINWLSQHKTENVVGRVNAEAINLQAICQEYEGFDPHELQFLVGYGAGDGNGVSLLNQAPYIQSNSPMTDFYYQSKIKDLLYKNLNGIYYTSNETPVLVSNDNNDQFKIEGRSVNMVGLVPFRAVFASNYYLSCAGNGQSSGYTTRRFPFVYNLPEYYHKDFVELRTKVINKYLNNINGSGVIPAEFDQITSQPFPFMPQGSYPVTFRYILPDRSSGTSGVFNFYNPIQ